MKASNGKCNRTYLIEKKMWDILVNLSQLISRRMRNIREAMIVDEILGYEDLLDSLIQNHGSNFIFDMAVMSKEGACEDVHVLLSH